MPVIKFTQDNIITNTSGIPELRIRRRDYFSLNSDAVEATGIKPGDKVTVYCEITTDCANRETAQWYLVHDPKGFDVKEISNRKSVRFGSQRLARKILDANNLPEISYSVQIAKKQTRLEDGTKGWCLIMSSAKI